MIFLLFILAIFVFSCDNNGNNDYGYEIDYCEDSDVFSNINGITTTDEQGNIDQYNAQNDDWYCCSIINTIGLLSSDSNSNDIDLIPYLITIDAAYPNPSVNTFNFDFSLNEALYISIFVIDEHSEQIDIIMDNEHTAAGNHESEWNPDSSIEGGLYRIILSVENSDNINCYGNVCLCLGNQNCSEVCGY